MDFEAEIRRRVTLVEKEAEGEKTVSRHIFRKVTELQSDVSQVQKDILDIKKDISALRDEVVLLRGDLPGIIASVVGALLREERERK